MCINENAIILIFIKKKKEKKGYSKEWCFVKVFRRKKLLQETDRKIVVQAIKSVLSAEHVFNYNIIWKYKQIIWIRDSETRNFTKTKLLEKEKKKGNKDWLRSLLQHKSHKYKIILTILINYLAR